MGNTTNGSKYSENTDIAIVARCVRKDIRAAIADGTLPAELKTSVTISRYAGGQSLGVEIKSGVAVICNTHRVRAELLGNDTHDFFLFSAPARETMAALVEIVNAYNSTTIHGEFSNPTVKFYASVHFTGGLLDACKDRTREAFEAAAAKAAAADAKQADREAARKIARAGLELLAQPAQLVLF